MPLLPWLPASRKKRFPVTKRSPKANNELIISTPEPNEKVSKDLQGIFGGNNKHGDVESSMKMKRSSENTHALLHDISTNDGKSQMENVHVHEAHKKQKRDVSVTDDDDEAENDNGMFNLKTLMHNLIKLFSLFPFIIMLIRQRWRWIYIITVFGKLFSVQLRSNVDNLWCWASIMNTCWNFGIFIFYDAIVDVWKFKNVFSLNEVLMVSQKLNRKFKSLRNYRQFGSLKKTLRTKI